MPQYINLMKHFLLNSGRYPAWRTIFFYDTFIWIIYMFRATMCSSSGPNFMNTTSGTITEWLYLKLCSYNCPPEDEHIVARNM